ncbi:MAG: tetratricopeptide repeat protein, partial [Lamprobacter sp.]|uniref:tetratricopeptide repeat protein n=1 Tax=Lamprobacter sp. TaxID=3100796 RepID=UPI002B25BA5E
MSSANELCPACGKTTLNFFPRAGKYRCIDIGCGEEFLPDQLHARSSAGSEVLNLDSLPFPVAYPLAHAGDGRLAARDRAANAIFAGYQAMRVTALLLLADYLACDTVCRQLQGPIRGLRLPHWYDWGLLCDQLAKFWSGRLQERPERASAFPNLVAAWLEVNRHGKLPRNHPWRELLAGLPGLQGPSAQSLNDALWKARNDRAHRESTRTVEEGAEQTLLPRLLAVSEAMVQRLFPAGELTLWRRIGTDNETPAAICLQGAHADLRFAIADSPEVAALGWGASDLLASTDTVDLPLYPLFVPLDNEGAEQSLPGGGLIEPVGLVDGIGAKKIAVLGVRSHCELPELVAPIQAGLALKEVQLGVERAQTQRWSLVSWATVTAEDTLNALRGRKYFPDLYLERAGVDGLVRQVLDQPGRGLLLLGEAGSGKSSLLARLVDGLLGEEPDGDPSQDQVQTNALGFLARRGAGDVVLFLSGADAYQADAAWSGRQTLCEAVLRRAGIASGAFTDLDDLCRHLDATSAQDLDADRRVWLILDAINEADRFTDLLKAVDDFLPALHRYPWLRLVISLRSGAYQSLAQRHRDLLQHGSEVLANARFLVGFTDEREKEVPYLELRPFAVAEAREAYQLRQRHCPEQSCPVSYDGLAPSLRELVRVPLSLHLFHETFRGRSDAPSDLDEGRLLGAHLDRLQADLPGVASHLRRLGVLMYERRIPFLPLEDAHNWVTEWRAQLGAENALRVVKLDPVEELVAASLLMRPTKVAEGVDQGLAGYGFSHQRLSEQLLLRELNRQIFPRRLPTADELLCWARHAGGSDNAEAVCFDELAGALETVTAALAEQGFGDVLSALLELEDEAVRTRLIGSAIKCLGPLARSNRNAVDVVIAPMIERGILNPEQGARFITSAEQTQDWLAEHGFSLVAMRVGEGRLTVARALVSARPESTDLLNDLVRALLDLGNLEEVTGLRECAQDRFTESLKISRELVAQGSDLAGSHLALCNCLHYLNGLASASGDMAESRAYCDERVEIARLLVAQEPEDSHLSFNLANSLINLGDSATEVGDWSTSRCCFEESIQILRSLIVKEPERSSFKNLLGSALSGLSLTADYMGDWGNSLNYLKESLEISRALVVQEPARVDLKRELITDLSNIAVTVWRDREREGITEARELLEEALEIARAIVAQQPDNVYLRMSLALITANLGTLADEMDDQTRAQRYFEDSKKVLCKLVAQEPDRADFKWMLAGVMSNLCEVLETLGDDEKALCYCEQSLEILHALMAQEVDTVDLQLTLARTYFNRSKIGSSSEQREWLQLVFDTLEPLHALAEAPKDVSYIWDRAVKALRELDSAVVT